MSFEQIALFVLIGGVLVALLWGRFRYDLIAFAALIIGVTIGIVPADTAFSGFGHDATIIIALVLVVTAGLLRSGAIDIVARIAVDRTRSLTAHIAILGGVGAALSGFINNVAALALLMPIDMQAAQKAARPPSVTLMPLAFATILGGMLTMIGTPPNIIIAAYRQQVTGEGFAMFDFTPVGAACALAGLAFIAFGGWRLIPQHKENQAKPDDESSALYTAELVVNEKSRAIGQVLRDLDPEADEHDCTIVGLVRRNKRLAGRARREKVKKGDLIVIHGSPDALNALAGALGLSLQGKSGEQAELTPELAIVEAIVASDSRIVGRTANEIQMMRGFGVSLLGISRSGKAIKERVRRTPLQTGDVLLLLGNEDTIENAITSMGCLPMAGSIPVVRHEKAWAAIGLFGAAVAAGAFGITPLTVALGAVAVLYVLFGILPVRDIYTSIEWPVVVLLGSLLPVGMALETSGGTAILAGGLAQVAQHLPPWMALMAVLVVTMTLSDALNNAATAVIAAPVAYGLAQLLEVNPDAFLMAVAIGASCAFLTPIGHNNNALIMGPGGYRFSDYWRIGLPLELIIVAIGVPAIMIFWPL
ncbi:SLC13 family permease [Pelagibacterium lentulum]|uniref:Permease n=1 Tax=Pelagibacterium lentulum TaxID=2029865 RepID=A0A916R5D9_9HYPH|nr:SLC13 family permease [Pelagibacterium lentulum]GGA34917.1 permease [Pelagibacterium lentulum]